MKRFRVIIFSMLIFLTCSTLVCSESNIWTGEENTKPTVKSSTPVDPSLLDAVIDSSAKAMGDSVNVSINAGDFPKIVMTVTIQTESGQPVRNLTLEDFLVREQSDLEASPTVEMVESVTESVEGSGISLGLLFDISGSMIQQIDQARQTALCLIDNMRDTDRVMLMTFSGAGSAAVIMPPGPVSQDSDNNGIYDIIEKIESLTASAGQTAAYDATAAAVTELLAENRPKAILLFSDGLSNNDSLYDVNDVIQMATDANIPVATLIYGNEDQHLDDLAAGTGGVAFNGATCGDMNAFYNTLTENQPGTYTIVYTTHNPTEDGTTRTVEVIYNGVSGVTTYSVSGTRPDDETPCTGNCGGGSGCFIQSAGIGTLSKSCWILPVLFALLAVGCIVPLYGRRFRKKDITIVMVISALIITGLTAGSAQAGLRKNALSISPMAGFYYFDDDQEIEKDPVAGFGLGYQFAENWGVEVMLNYGRYDFNYLVADQCTCRTDDVSATLGRIDLLYHLWPDKNLVPYFALGMGGMSLDFDNFDKEDDAFADYGGGIQYFLSEDIALRADVRGIYTLDDHFNNLAATIGVTFLLGGKPKAQCPVTKAVAPVEITTPTPVTLLTPKPADFQILFGFNQTQINPNYYDNFKQVADYLNAYRQIVLRIEGHTDALGSEAYNRALSLRRAQSVSHYLSNNFNIPQSRMYVVGFGESKPVADNSTDAGRRLNRRAELMYLVPAETSGTTTDDIVIPFAFDSVEIDPSLRGQFKEVADYLNSYQEIVLGIAGNTDSTGPESYNQELSMRRALMVGNYLNTNFHISDSQLQFIGFGESNPVGDNGNSAGRRSNRRVELQYFKPVD